jgi:hypothetical protein
MERAGTTTMAAAMMEVQDEECELSSWVVSVHDLPDEVLVAVFALLEPIHHAAAITLTCRRWRDVFHSDPPLWRAFHERLIGGPLVPALITGPALPSYYACVAGDQVSCQLDKQMRAVDREAWFSHNEWRAAVEWKVSRVREWGITPEGRIEWAALLGCSRLLAALLERHWHALSGTGRAHEAVTKALRAAACANDVDSVKVRVRVRVRADARVADAQARRTNTDAVAARSMREWNREEDFGARRARAPGAFAADRSRAVG